jgi:DNA-binding NtrC family response regulator
MVEKGQRASANLLSARALGWMGREKEAAARLANLPAEYFWELEPEERPFTWALAGDVGRAVELAWETPWESFWAACLRGLTPPAASWDRLEGLEAFRAARFVFDCEVFRPGLAPSVWVRRALRTFNEMGATRFADRLGASSLRAWRSLGTYLDHPQPTVDQTARLLSTAGYAGVRLSLRHNGSERLLIDGSGGDHCEEWPFQGGKLALSSPIMDDTLSCFMTLIRERLSVELPAEPGGVDPGEEGILGESESLVEAIRLLDGLASGDKPLLILGETGTGKELAARRCHRLSRRAQGPFRAINCGELTESLTQSELFGHAKGAFTGAEKQREGIFEAADGGTVFLDEIGDLPLKLQTILLRVLQQREVRRVGENRVRDVDVRAVAATHRDLLAMVEEGTFREDLYFRLNAGCIRLPPLRERGDDLLRLARHFIRSYARANRMEGPTLAPAAERLMRSHTWPGNVRELKNVVESAVCLVTGRSIQATDLRINESVGTPPAQSLDEEIRCLEVKRIEDALARNNGRKAPAARDLGLSRQGLSYRMRKLGIS